VTRINVMRPWLGPEEVAAVTEVIESGWIAQGPRVAAFETAFSQRMSAGHSVAVSSCTTALHLALIVAGVSRGDDVVVPSFSFIATANSAVYVGARPVFADVEPRTGNLTAESVRAALTPRTTAVVLVDQAGVPSDLDAVRAVCDPRGIVVVEDAACGAGALYKGRPVGERADLTAWSFHPRKIVTTGEGGMVTTSRADWAARLRRLREHAMDISAAERHLSVLAPAERYVEVGYNFRMTDLQAAVGLVQLRRLDEIVARRREIARRYQSALRPVPGLRPVEDPPHGHGNYQSMWVEVSPPFPLDREALLARLAERDISARRGIMAIHRQPAYAGLSHRPLPITERLSESTLILPIFHEMTEDQQDQVIDAVVSAAREAA
jgi:dTDP-4-amino-4,6-dideoxygalactose transaminase